MRADAVRDVLIVGTGVVGASTAFHLSSMRTCDLEVLGRGAAGSGMSSRSSALVRMHYTYAPEVVLAVRSDRMFDAWPELVGRPSCVTRTGFLRIVRPGEEPQLRANVEMQRSLGVDVEVVDALALGDLAPGLRNDDLTLAAYERHGGYGDGSVVAGDFLDAARRNGATYRPDTTVRALVRNGDRVVGVETDRGSILAGTVVLCTGVWSVPLLESAGVSLPIETELHHVAVLRHQAGRGAPLACIDSTTQTYFRPDAGGFGTLVGTFDGARGHLDPDSVQPAAAVEELPHIVEAASHRVPALVEAGVARGVAGVYDMTPDARPLLGALPGLEGLVVAVGFSGMGFKISPAVGECVAHLVVGDGAAPVDLRPFRPSRFDEGEPIEPPHPYSDD